MSEPVNSSGSSRKGAGQRAEANSAVPTVVPADGFTNPIASSADQIQFRRTVSHFATGIAIITCEDDEGQARGMTVNSFTSISLDPPTVLIALRAGKAHRMITRRGRFGASVLNDDQQSYSAHFSGTPHESFVPDFIVRHRTPTLRQCLAWFECEITERIQIHDHTLFVARVMHCDVLDGQPLMFYANRYHRPLIAA